MFVDKVAITVQAGDGGNGVISFRHEKFINKGGPDGGDGGHGGNVVLRASRNQDTLVTFRYQKLLKAESGKNGSKRKKHGKSGADAVVAVPVGTIITMGSGEVLADLTQDGQEVVIARGGRGGFGNAHFTSSTRQAPRLAEKGEQGEQFEAVMELKMIADVGLVGLPNAGKSTFLSVVSNAKPEIADYPFTTLRPNLGMVDIDSTSSLLVADIPGLIEGASQGKGLGDEFLRHVERTRVLIHLIDVHQDDVAAAYRTIQNELKAYVVDLTKRPQIVVLTKIDGVDPAIIKIKLNDLKKVVPKNTGLLSMSAPSGEGVRDLLFAIKKLLNQQRITSEKAAEQELPVIRLRANPDTWRVEKVVGGFVVSGQKIERFAQRTDFSNPQAVQRLRDILKKTGVMRELTRQGIAPGESIGIKGHEDISY